jgi:predicted house-cleaning noncanonical NTP pyrophosphatase (MazG superfamily)
MAEKLVRDLIPVWDVAKGGEQSVFRLAAPEEMEKLLAAKVMEEAQEVCSAPDAASMILEMADLLEVVYALAALYGWEPKDIELAREGKAVQRGRFTAGLVLVTDD